MIPETTPKKPVVAFLGPLASYSHQATLQRFSTEKYELVPVVTIKDVFDATQSGQADYGVVPVENSTNGSVVFTLDYFADRSGVYPDLSVCAEIYQDVHHCLLGNSSSLPPALAPSLTSPSSTILNPTETPRSHPLYDLSKIQRIYSHPQVWGQCTRFLNAYLHGIETIDVSSTSRAAELARDDTTGTSAAISSSVAVQLTHTTILAENIEDREDNTTRFFVLSRHDQRRMDDDENGDEKDSSSSSPSSVVKTTTISPESGGSQPIPTKSLLSFTVPHRHPGALADVLACFRGQGEDKNEEGLNLTSINSRPSQVEPFQYIFFVEFEGHKFRDPQGKVRDVLDKVDKVAERSRWLGSWVAKR